MTPETTVLPNLRSLLFSLSLAAGISLMASQVGYTKDHGHRSYTVEMARAEAMDHYEDGNYGAFVEIMEAVALESGESVDRYNLACGYALDGRPELALEGLEQLVEHGAARHFSRDEDFRSLRGRPEFFSLMVRATLYERMDEELEPLRDLAMDQYHAERYDLFVQMMERVVQYSTDDVDLYNLACGYALNGQSAQAIATLEQLAAWGPAPSAAHDEDFASLRHDRRFQAVLERLSG